MLMKLLVIMAWICYNFCCLIFISFTLSDWPTVIQQLYCILIIGKLDSRFWLHL